MNPSETKFGTLDQLVAGFDPDIQRISRSLRTLILNLHPDVVEVVRLGDGTALSDIGPKKLSEVYSYSMPKESYVNLGFYYGVSLADPAGLMEETGKNLRHVNVRSKWDATWTSLTNSKELSKSFWETCSDKSYPYNLIETNLENFMKTVGGWQCMYTEKPDPQHQNGIVRGFRSCAVD